MSNESNEIRELTAAELDIVGGGHHHQTVNVTNSFNFESFNGVGNGAIGNTASFNGIAFSLGF